MKKIVSAALYLGFLACTPSIASDLYRCDTAQRTVYQATQCEIGAAQKAIDPQNARREQIRKSRDLEREQKRQKSVTATTAG